MQQFYGTKKIQARPMNRQEYNDYRGWELPANENAYDEGYLVEYLDGGNPNDSRHAGYISWSPKEIFEKAHQPIDALSFGHAIVALKEGKKIRHNDMLENRYFKLSKSGDVIEVYDGQILNNELSECSFDDELVLRNDWQIVA